MLDYIEDTLVLRTALTLSLHLYRNERKQETTPSITRAELTCSRTFALSTGAVTSVEGIAERKPAVAYSATERSLLVRFGVTA